MTSNLVILLPFMIFCDGLVERQSQLRFSQQDASTCTTCVDRSQKTIHAFYHGNEEDPFWHAIIAAANQAGFNHRITFKTTLYPSFDATSMAEDIQQAVEDGDVDAMIVSTPSSEVREAVKAATDRGMAIFGMKSGYNDPRPQASSSNLGLAAMIGQDEFRSGQVAARRFLKARAVIRKAVFVNDEPGQEALDQRFNGFRETILESNPNAVIEHVQVGVWNAFANFSVERELQPILGTCDCDLVLSGGSWPAPHALEVVQRWNEQCSRTPNFNETLFGTFDATKDIIAGIETGDVLFAISQQPYLQATVPVLLASLYVVTGKKLADPSSPVVTGPVLLDSDSLRSEQFRYCADQGFVGNDCDERDTIYIAAVLDDYNFAGQSGDELLVAAVQASRDVGTSLAVYILDEEAMVQRIEDLCQQRAVDGLFVSLPSAKVAVSVKSCESLGVRAIVLETEAEHGLEFSKSVGSFQRDSDDTAAKYFQGYLPIALLTYIIESEKKFEVAFRFETGPETSCSVNTLVMCDEYYPYVDDTGLEGIALKIVLFILLPSLLAVGVLAFLVSFITNRLRVYVTARAAESDDATASIDEDEPDDDGIELNKDSRRP